jgi:Transglycosylase SLT domain
MSRASSPLGSRCRHALPSGFGAGSPEAVPRDARRHPVSTSGGPDLDHRFPRTVSAGRAYHGIGGEAVSLATYWITRGYSVDLGLTQTNNRNLPDLHLTLEQVLGDDDTSECANLHAGSMILTRAYGRAIERFGEGQGALAAALSAYNTGGFTAGFTNGYVARYYGPVPALAVPQVHSREPGPAIRTALVNRHLSDTDVW